MLIVTILAGGLEFATVSAGSVGLKITRAYGMHIIVWAVFVFYLYAYRTVRRNILGQLENMKTQTLWEPYVKWLSNMHFRADLKFAIGKDLSNVGLRYSNRNEYIGEEKTVGSKQILHLDLSLDDATSKKLLESGRFTES